MQRSGHTDRLGRFWLGAMTLQAVGDGVVRIPRPPAGLSRFSPRRLTVWLAARSLALPGPRIRIEQ